ncbi:MAG: transcriptional repressor [Candidatus Marinimicrobia bacterium]|nr:transcriptional repressor [Candidatus Neomarinimicrobiota bacterium]MCF7829842.1 transcriptional repressor [Candidatus Neomarinimicrobiota bacterium]MCF7882470.1 transcriptional repressor [Candidatus Neomarinimicrobiota bacterium]
MAKERYSRQREAILVAVEGTKRHPTAEWVYETVRKQIPNISLGTVYRNLNYLVKKGQIREVILDDNITRYDGNRSKHFHCVCEECGTIYDVAMDTDEFVENLSGSLESFTVNSHKLEMYGICQDCTSG